MIGIGRAPRHGNISHDAENASHLSARIACIVAHEFQIIRRAHEAVKPPTNKALLWI
jgi:hypothetical protein